MVGGLGVLAKEQWRGFLAADEDAPPVEAQGKVVVTPERERPPGVDLARGFALLGFSGSEARGLGRSVRDAAARRHVSDLEVLPDGP